MFQSDALHRIGLLDCDFFAYYEDVDWCLRAMGSNAQLLHVPAAIVRHDISYTFRKTGERDEGRAHYYWMQSQPLALYLAYRNRLLLAGKHARGSLHLGFLVLRRLGRAALHAVLLILVGRGRQARAIVDGSYDGLRRPPRPPLVQRYLPAKLEKVP